MKPTPHSIPEVLERAAQLIRTNGLHRGDYVADPFNRHGSTPHNTRPMDAVGALLCAVSGDPRTPSNLGWQAVQYVGRLVLVDGQPAWGESYADLERHLHDWSDQYDAEYVVAWLLAQARVLNSRLVVAA